MVTVGFSVLSKPYTNKSLHINVKSKSKILNIYKEWDSHGEGFDWNTISYNRNNNHMVKAEAMIIATHSVYTRL